jgi:imidazoleglycerol-phosphate dehydratase / histidinol-phosphatase
VNKKALFIDRDGTIIVEPPDTFQVDNLEQLEFIPKVIRNLYYIRKNLEYEMVIVSNQDGLGTESYPEENYSKVQGKMLNILQKEGVFFDDIIIDKTMPEEKQPTRKPGTALLTKYTQGSYDLDLSYVIGDRMSDIMLARNLGAKGILIGSEDRWDELRENGLERFCSLLTDDWDAIYAFIALPQRSARVRRKTKETDVDVLVNLDGTGVSYVSTGLKFFDHMLEQIGRHAGFSLTIEVEGDLDVDEHHTIEDTAIALGEAVREAIANKVGMERYGYCLPMDESLASVALDFGGRSWLVWDVSFKRDKIGDVPTEMFFHFFKSFCDAARCNLNVKAEGDNDHHRIEAVFKAFAKSLKMAIRRDPYNTDIPSTKGVIE